MSNPGRDIRAAEAGRSRAWVLPFLGILLAFPSLLYLALITLLGEEAAERADAFFDTMMPLVLCAPVLAPLSLAVALFAFVGFLRRRTRSMAAASLIWSLGAAAHAVAARDIASRMEALWKGIEALLRW